MSIASGKFSTYVGRRVHDEGEIDLGRTVCVGRRLSVGGAGLKAPIAPYIFMMCRLIEGAHDNVNGSGSMLQARRS
jgi:hypothetical protein